MINYGILHVTYSNGAKWRQSVPVKNEFADRWLALFEGRWRRVHIQVKSTFIVCEGRRLTIEIEGV